MADALATKHGRGKQLAVDDIGNRLFQRFKITQGSDGVDGGDISVTNPLPIHPFQGVPGSAGPVDGANGLPIEDAAMVKQLTRVANGIAMILGVKPGDLDG